MKLEIPRKANGKINWVDFIFGKNKRTFVMTTILFIALLLMAYGYYNDTKVCREFQANPCEHPIMTNYTRYCIDVGRPFGAERPGILEDEIEKYKRDESSVGP